MRTRLHAAPREHCHVEGEAVWGRDAFEHESDDDDFRPEDEVWGNIEEEEEEEVEQPELEREITWPCRHFFDMMAIPPREYNFGNFRLV